MTQQSTTTVSTVDALAAVARLALAIGDTGDRRRVYSALAGELLSIFGLARVNVARVTGADGLCRGNSYRRGPDGETEAATEYAHRFDEQSAIRRVIETGEALAACDAAGAGAMHRGMGECLEARGALMVPVAVGGDVRAVVGLFSEAPRLFREDEVRLACTLAGQASAALAAVEMRGRLGARTDQQAALARAAHALRTRQDLSSMLATFCGEANVAVGGDVASIYLGDSESGGVAVAADGQVALSGWLGSVLAPGDGAAGRVLMTGRPLRGPGSSEFETAVAVPMSCDEELKGVLAVGYHSLRQVSDEDMSSLQAIADLAAVACSKTEAFEQAQAQAKTDSLTGLLNHGAVHVRLTEEISRARRGGDEPCCLLVDLDDFKSVNDRHGHLVGDEVLRQVASSISAEFRSYDGLGRFGGDEFVLVLSGTEAETGMAAGRRLQAAVLAAAEMVSHLGIELTASVGVARWEEQLTAGELLNRADRALLLAKRRGKASVVFATPETERELAGVESPDAGATRMVNELWGTVSTCRSPQEVLDRLPGFLRPMLALEEVALFSPHRELPGFVRTAGARAPGDPGPAAFATHGLFVDQDRVRALRSQAVSCDTLADLHLALGASDPDGVVEQAFGSYAALPIVREGQAHGLLLMRSPDPRFPQAALQRAELLVEQAVIAMLGQSAGASRSAVAALAAAIDARDNYTHSHSQQVVEIAVQTARVLGLSETEIEHVRDGAMLHDVGKVAIPNEILNKAARLTEEEWAVMREHSAIGERILRRTPELAAIAPLVRHEHERWDGNGYPDRLQGEEIPMGSRIIFACDAYNAMITARPYRAPMTHDDAVAELRAGAGTQFDPCVLDALLHVLSNRSAEAVHA